MASLKFRLRNLSGRQTVLSGLDPQSTVGALKVRIEAETGVKRQWQRIEFGYPPTPLTSPDTATLAASQLRSGVTLTLKEDRALDSVQAAPAAASRSSQDAKRRRPGAASSAASNPTSTASASSPSSFKMTRRTIPDDNSCLYNAVGYACENGSLNSASTLRQVCASIVLSKPSLYSTAILGKTPQAYVQDLLNPKRWGGSIELGVLSGYFACEIVAVDVQTKKPYTYGQGKHGKRAYLVYNGIHYDTVVGVSQSPDGKEKRTYTFSPTDTAAFAQVMAIVDDLHISKRFVNVATFTLRCVNCGKGLVGAAEAQKHAQDTGHVNFCQYAAS